MHVNSIEIAARQRGILHSMDPTLLTKVLAGALGLTCTMVLALTGKIDGPTAMTAVQTITGVFLGSAAVLGGAQAIAGAMGRRSAAAAPEPPKP